MAKTKVTSEEISTPYETTEKVIGSWIDGRKIYRKVLSLGAGPNSTDKIVAHSISNLDFFINIYGGARTSAGTITRMFPVTTSSTNGSVTTISSLRQDADTSSLKWTAAYNATGETGYAVLEYVKTT